MAVFDTGPIDNRNAPRTTELTIRMLNTGRLPALVGIEVYQINPTGGGFGNETIYVVELVNLNPFTSPDSAYTLTMFLLTWTYLECECSRADSGPTTSP